MLFLTLLVFGSISKPIDRELVSVYVISGDVLFVKSSQTINKIWLEGSHQYSHFVDYGPKFRQAVILLRTESPTLELRINVGSLLGSKTYIFYFKNPRKVGIRPRTSKK